MMKNHHLAKAIADAGWAEFMRQCEYKAKHEGRIFAKIGTFFPELPAEITLKPYGDPRNVMISR